MSSVSYSYGATIPPMTPLTIEKIETKDLFKLVRSAEEDHGTLGFAVGSALKPVGILKKSHSGDAEIKFVSSSNSTGCRAVVSNFVRAWPTKMEPYIDRYVWFNHEGLILAPLFDVRANIIGLPVFALDGLIEMWAQSQDQRIAVIWTNDGVPMKVGIDQLLIMILASLPITNIRSVMTRFTSLGQSFLRWYVYEVEHNEPLKVAGHGGLIASMRKLGTFPIYGTTSVIRSIAQEGLLWKK